MHSRVAVSFNELTEASIVWVLPIINTIVRNFFKLFQLQYSQGNLGLSLIIHVNGKINVYQVHLLTFMYTDWEDEFITNNPTSETS